VSRDLQQWLRDFVGVSARKTLFIPNGVDTDRFRPDEIMKHVGWAGTAHGAAADASTAWAQNPVPTLPGIEMWDQRCFIIGTVGRIQDIKNHDGLIDAFLHLRKTLPTEEAQRLRLAIVGDGPLLPAIKQKVLQAGLEKIVWLPGARRDISDIMRRFSIFVLPSFAEGTPVTILEAMSTGLPIIASRVGGIPEVVEHGVHGLLVPPKDTLALADALKSYLLQPSLLQKHGAAARASIEDQSSVKSMVAAYMELYDALCREKGHSMEPVKSCAE
jgi:glycosyltransferase involved in cell wall biosynthesis